MKSRWLRSSLLRLTIIILSILDNTILSTTMTSGGTTHHHRRIQLPRSVDALRKFTCRDAQSRAYHLKDLMQQSVYQNSDESANQPVYIVLKRCDGHSGCCMSPDMSCSPIASAIYYEEMEIEIWSFQTNDTRRQWIRVEQHGKCSCEVTTTNDRYQLEHKQPNVTLISS